MRRATLHSAAGLVLLLAWAGAVCGAEEPAAATGDRPATVLDADSPWRAYCVLRPPVIALADGPKPILMEQTWLNRPTAEPPAAWTAPDFDDGGWNPTSARSACATPYLARLCLRGKFKVTEPSRVTGLRLSLAYHGGAVVYFNGREVARGHLAGSGGGAGGEALAEGYPREAFVTDAGKLAPGGDRAMAGHPKVAAVRRRALGEVAIPGEMVRAGVNVVAVEIVRAPYHAVVEELRGAGVAARELESRGTPYDLSWNTCEVADVRLTAESGEGLAPGAAPPPGLQVWNGDILAWDSEGDFGNPAERLRPVSMAGPRGGAFSGKLLVGSQGPVKGLKVSAGDLKADGGATIAASQVRIRYAVPWDVVARYGARPPGYDILLESPREEFAAGKGGRALVPVWVTVKVPRAAAPGTYRGELSVGATGEERRSVPVEVRVLDWALPDPQQWRTWVELVQSPDALAVEYEVPLWSERHWAMIGRSMDFFNEIGSRVVYVPLICHTNFGNEQSMVRWIRKGGDGWEHDFTVMERYLDTAQKHMGRPKIVCFNAWDIYLNQPKEAPKEGNFEYDQWSARYALRGKGPAVTVLDPASGKTEAFYLPRFEAPESQGLWGPVFAGVFERMRRRGLEDTMMLGMFWELWPSKAEVEFFSGVAPGLSWVNISHLARAAELYGVGKIGYWTKAFGLEYTSDPSQGRSYGWKRADLLAEYHRFGYWNGGTPATIRHDAEFNITGNQRGIGRIGGDYWLAIKDKQGRRVAPMVERYPQAKWHNWDIGSWLLGPGPDGPVATARFENVREGVQECEARIFIETALTDASLRARLGDELARRCQEALDERLRYLWLGVSTLRLTGTAGQYATYTPQRNQTFSATGGGVAGQAWFVTTGWQERNARLYGLAGEVAARIGSG